MLTRAARRRNVLHHLRLSTEQFPVPWLCPATVRLHTQLNRPENASSPSSSTPSTLRRRPSFSQPIRHLATTADDSALLNSNQNAAHVRFDSMGYPNAATQNYDDLWNVKPLYNEPAIIINESELVTEPSLKRSGGVGGSVSNMVSKFTVALKTGDIDTAARVLDRLAQFYNSKDPMFLDLHNRYLELVVSDLIANQSSEAALRKATSVQVWYEVKLPKGNLKPNARTMAVMLRMALRVFHGSKRERLVRRYWNMVQQNSFEDEVMFMNDLLTERDLGEISQVRLSLFYRD
jgi:DNA-directed RNA polymerase, mitochondrial